MPFLSYSWSELVYSLIVDPKLFLIALYLHLLSIPFHPGCVSESAKKGSFFKGGYGHGKKERSAEDKSLERTLFSTNEGPSPLRHQQISEDRAAEASDSNAHRK